MNPLSPLDSLMLEAYYADSLNPPREISDYFDSAWELANKMKPEDRGTWINILLREMVDNNACEDEADGRDHLVHKMFVGFPGTNEKLE